MKIKPNKPCSIHLRLTDEQYQFCELYSKQADLKINDFIRCLIDLQLMKFKLINKANNEVKNADNTYNK